MKKKFQRWVFNFVVLYWWIYPTSLNNLIKQQTSSALITEQGYKDLICTIIPSRKGMKLGFYRGSELPDPAKLLTGSGNLHKFVEINSAKDIANPALKKLLNEAIKAHQNRKA
jgi:hypothetical protein